MRLEGEVAAQAHSQQVGTGISMETSCLQTPFEESDSWLLAKNIPSSLLKADV